MEKRIISIPLCNKYSLLDRAFGCITGAFLGDSIGSYLEFKIHPEKKLIDEAMKMPGNGIWKIAPGQLTDDSELALSLAYGLLRTPSVFNKSEITAEYIRWAKSGPFDIGTTTKRALLNREIDSKSESNGCVMRITPLAIWSYKLSALDIRKAVWEDVSITHANQTVKYAAECYVLAIVYLLNCKKSPKIAMEEAFNYINDYINENIVVKKSISNIGGLLDSSPEKDFLEWWDVVKKEKMFPGEKKMGWLKLAWSYAFIFLKQKNDDYDMVIQKVLEKGGDTDTNCCIVGGLIGAAIGVQEIDKSKVEILLNCDFSKGKQKRDIKYNPGNIMRIVPELIKIAPDKLVLETVEEQIKKSKANF